MAAARESRGRSSGGYVLAAAVAGVVVWTAWDNGSYGLASRGVLAIAVFWTAGLAVCLAVASRVRIPPGTVLVGALFAALATWTLASTAWAPSAEDALTEFNRVALYLGVYVLVALAASRRSLGRWADGLAAGIVAVAVVALVGRLFPGSLPDEDISAFLPSAANRLSFPLGYWNGLAVLVALGLPLLLRIAVAARTALARALGLAPVPAVAATVYLTSSRGGIAAAAAGTAVFVALVERRWRALAAVFAGSAGAAAAVAALVDRAELVNGPLGGDLARDQGRSAAIVIAIACAATAAVYGVADRLVGPRFRPAPRLSRITAAAALAAAVAGLVVAGVVGDPVARLEAFKRPPPAEQLAAPDSIEAHLLSAGGSARWQFWSAAIDQWRAHPLLGDGGGSYESWWAEHGDVALFVRDAHSLYLESLGELGVVGFLLVAGLVVAGVSVGARRSLLAAGDLRDGTAAATAVFAAYAFAAGFDWMWELPAVGVVGVAALALATGPGAVSEPAGAGDRPRIGLGVVALVAALLLVAAQAAPLLAERGVARSREAVRAGDLQEAAEAAEGARNFAPWAATPYLQLALVEEEAGELGRARMRIGEAIERDRRDWRLWLVSARVETKLGRVAAAERSIRRAVALNPRSPLLRRLLPGAGG